MGLVCSEMFGYSEEERKRILDEDDKRMDSKIVKFYLKDLQKHYYSTFQPRTVAFDSVKPWYNFNWHCRDIHSRLFCLFCGIETVKSINGYICWKPNYHISLSDFLEKDVGGFKEAKLGFTQEQVVALGLDKLQKEMIDKNN